MGIKLQFLFWFFRRTEEDTGEKTDVKIFSCENFPSWDFGASDDLVHAGRAVNAATLFYREAPRNVLWTTKPYLTLRRHEGEQSF